MKIFLTLKSWQIFLLIWGIPFLTIFIPLESMTSPLIMILTLLFGIMLFLWIYSLGKYLPEKLKENIIIPSKGFQIHLLYLIFIVIVLYAMPFFREFIEQHFSIFLLIILYYFVSVIIVFRHAAKLLSSVELGRLAKISDYLGYFFMFWFSPIGIWIIQPKVRKYFVN